jgi:hypothetical protein
MYYHNNKGKKIFIANPHRALNLSRGGRIPNIPGSEKHPTDDTILSKLEAGSLVVPRPAVRHMKDYTGPTTGPVQTAKSKLVQAITMPDEIVIHRKHAPRVESFLRKKGITLPLGR